jgi:SNF2 family DNA or RNA helicase
LELYNLLHLLKKGHLGTIKEFRKKFLHKGNKRHPLNPLELKKKLDEVMIRRRRDETNIDYKARIPRIITIEQTPQEKMIYADILISTDTGAEGLNFQFCRNLINYDLPWNPMSVEQRIGRLDRIGQKREMYIYSFATKGTMEENVVDLIINKMCCVGLVIGELPIILFNLGLDSEGKAGKNKIEERLMNSFIDSKGNLDIFTQEVGEIAGMIKKGMKDYQESKESSSELLD